MAVKIRNSKTQEERTVTQELWDKMRASQRSWYAIGGDDSAKEVAEKPVAARTAPKAGKHKEEPEIQATDTATAVLVEN